MPAIPQHLRPGPEISPPAWYLPLRCVHQCRQFSAEAELLLNKNDRKATISPGGGDCVAGLVCFDL